MRRLRLLCLFLLAPILLSAQATHITTSGTLPANCRVGDIYEKTGGSAGLYRCSSTNTWTLLSGSGGGGAITGGTCSAGSVVTAIDTSGVPTCASASDTKIDEATPTSTGVVTFSSLGSYTNLRIVYTGRGDDSATSTAINLTFNGDTGSNYDGQRSAFGTSTSLGEQIGTEFGIIAQLPAGTATANYAGGGVIDIPNYRNTTFFKTAVAQEAGPVIAQSTSNIPSRVHSVFWRNTGAITSITLTLAAGNYVTGTKFTLYGVY